jgi:hypothetical protein
MIITLKNADFSLSNIGTLSTWRISRSLGAGATYDGATSVDKGAAFSATVTIAENYEVSTAGVTVTMGGITLSDAYSISDNVITITIASVTGNVFIQVPTVNTSTGEGDSGSVIDTILLSSSGAILKDGHTLDSGTYELTGSDDHYTYDQIPVLPNSIYTVTEGAGRMWLLNSSKNSIATMNVYTGDPQYKFMTTADTAYVSISFGKHDPSYAVASTAAITLVASISADISGTVLETITIANTGATLHEGAKLKSGNTDLAEQEGYFTYTNIPVEPCIIYKSYGSARVWFLKSDGTGIKTYNIYNGEMGDQYKFITPRNCTQISLDFIGNGAISPVPDKDTVVLQRYS